MDDSDDLITVDLRGLVCPEPVLRTKRLLDDPKVKRIEALVSDEINVSNLKRLARSHKLTFDWQASGDFFRVFINRAGLTVQKNALEVHAKADRVESSHVETESLLSSKALSANQVGTVIFITKDTFG